MYAVVFHQRKTVDRAFLFELDKKVTSHDVVKRSEKKRVELLIREEEREREGEEGEGERVRGGL